MNQINFFFEETEPFSFHQKQLKEYINTLIIKELSSVGDISVILCSDNYLLDINKQYLNHDYYTDIITFDYEEDNVISGDLFISVDRITENASNFDIDFVVELCRVVFHGILHLIGYNDKTDEEQKEMTEKENLYLKMVDFNNLK